jgi:hypothetical protein
VALALALVERREVEETHPTERRITPPLRAVIVKRGFFHDAAAHILRLVFPEGIKREELADRAGFRNGNHGHDKKRSLAGLGLAHALNGCSQFELKPRDAFTFCARRCAEIFRNVRQHIARLHLPVHDDNRMQRAIDESHAQLHELIAYFARRVEIERDGVVTARKRLKCGNFVHQAALSTLILALSAIGCAGNVPPHIAPIPVHQIPVGINDGWHGLANFALDCPHMIRTPQLSGDALSAFLTAAPIDCPVLALVEAPDVRLVDAVARERPAAIELGNELELKPYEFLPTMYGEWIFHAVTVLRAADYRGTIVLGGVYALTDDTKQAIKIGISRCIDAGGVCVVGVHLYDASDEDLQWLRDLDWPVWVTEVGYPTRCQPDRVRLQADVLQAQIARFSMVPRLERVFLYQRATGPTCSDLDTFGLSPSAMALLQF